MSTEPARKPLDAGRLWTGGLATAAVAATALLHLLALTTPRFTLFFTWIMVLLTVIATAIPLSLDVDQASRVATAVLNVVLGLAIMAILNGITYRVGAVAR